MAYMFLPKPKKGSKYKNKRTLGYDSKAEKSRAWELQMAERGGEIRDLREQVKYEFWYNRVLLCSYYADFVYFDVRKNCEVVEDVKGFRTKEYELKKKMMKAFHNIEIFETIPRY